MDRPTLKYFVDVVMYVAICAIAATGIILGQIIPPGGGGRYFLGFHRHEWGSIHSGVATIFLLVLAVHLFLNWAWVVGRSIKRFGPGWKRNLLLFSLAWIGVLAAGWLLSWF